MLWLWVVFLFHVLWSKRCAAIKRRDDWNTKNPNTPIVIGPQQIRSRVKNRNLDKETRIIKGAPREMRGRVASDVAGE